MTDDEIDNLITRAADTQAAQDQDAALDALRGRTVYFNVEMDSQGRQQIPTATLRPEFRALITYASRDDPRLRDPFGGLRWEEVQDMASKAPDLHGILVQSLGTGWIAVSKQDHWRAR